MGPNLNDQIVAGITARITAKIEKLGFKAVKRASGKSQKIWYIATPIVTLKWLFKFLAKFW